MALQQIGGTMQDVKVKFAYKTGFRRLWLIVSVIWLLFITYLTLTESDLHLAEWIKAGLIPIAVTYAIGAAFVWVIEGFARPDR
jgi:hypothetical protein